MKRRDRTAVTVLVAALALIAAGMLMPPRAPLPQSSATPAPSLPYREGILSRPSSVNPLTARTQADRDLVALLFRGLTRSGPNGELQPDLALNWVASDDGKTYTFVLRKDASWADGQPVTADDVVFTVGLLQDRAYSGPLGASWRGVHVTADGPRIVRFVLDIPRSGFLQATTLPLLPAHALGGVTIDALADSDFSQNPLGDGLFQLVELDDAHALLERVRPVAEGGGPFASAAPTATAPSAPRIGRFDGLTDIEFRFFDDAAAMADAFRAGALDAVGGLPSGPLEQATARPGARLVRFPDATLTAVVVNQRPDHPQFRSAEARQGLLAALDRDGLVSQSLGGNASRADSLIPPFSWAFDSTAVTAIPFNAAAAASLLGKGGWTLGAAGWAPTGTTGKYTLRLLSPDEATNAMAYRTALLVAADWKALGLGVDVQAVPAAEYVDQLTGGHFDAAVADLQIGLDPDLSPLLLSSQAVSTGTNVSGVQIAALDKLLIAARTAIGSAARAKALHDVEVYLSSGVPILPLYFRDYDLVVSERVGGIVPTQIADPSGRFWDVIDWRLASDG